MPTSDTERDALVDAVKAIAVRLEAEKSHLTDLDSAIGDADHGANMDRGFQAVLEQLEGKDGAEAADIVKTVGTALISEVGGAAGPLYGGSFMYASEELQDGITAESTVAFAEAYLEKVEDRGGATVGNKTMVDALTPAVQTYKKSIEQDDLSSLTALAKAVDACRRGVEFTVPLKATKGRASYLGWRSVGHQDPGATSTLFMLEEILQTAEDYTAGETEQDATSPTVPDADAEEE
ncbi:dihydroxyacetone kinase subunit L [halophilic archaeon]|nr:dihydroxyacetone kinase subunit L [halophilic archaeon]